jgi:hypothetical protein
MQTQADRMGSMGSAALGDFFRLQSRRPRAGGLVRGHDRLTGRYERAWPPSSPPALGSQSRCGSADRGS